ncbi:MAG: hypothetical protein AMXMBFR53_40360 [Gemmatimonadota bacterium]
MDPVTGQLLQHLADYGPPLLFVLAVLETCFVTGLVVPSGVATSVATVLALDGSLSLPAVVAAALSGGAVGDSLGYWIGRFTGVRVMEGQGRLGALARKRHAEVSRFFGRHPVWSVTAARLVSFVRTLMPMAAGMSGIAYPRFLAYEVVGLAAWVGLYVSIGVLARESFQLATQVVGVGGAAAFGVAGAFLWAAFRRRQRRRKRVAPRSEER